MFDKLCAIINNLRDSFAAYAAKPSTGRYNDGVEELKTGVSEPYTSRLQKATPALRKSAIVLTCKSAPGE